MVLTGDGSDVKVAESVDLQLEGQGWLEMTVDRVFVELEGTPATKIKETEQIVAVLSHSLWDNDWDV